MFTSGWSTHFAEKRILLRNWIWSSETIGSRRRRKPIRKIMAPLSRRISSWVAAFSMTQSLPDQSNLHLWISAVLRQQSSALKLGITGAWKSSLTGWTWLSTMDSTRKWQKSREIKLRRGDHSQISGLRNFHMHSRKRMSMNCFLNMELLQAWKSRNLKPMWDYRVLTQCLAQHMLISLMKRRLRQHLMHLMVNKFWRVPTTWELNSTKEQTSS